MRPLSQPQPFAEVVSFISRAFLTITTSTCAPACLQAGLAGEHPDVERGYQRGGQHDGGHPAGTRRVLSEHAVCKSQIEELVKQIPCRLASSPGRTGAALACFGCLQIEINTF